MYPLIADSGELTVLRSLAAFSYGKWDVSWPDSVPDDQRPELVDGRDFGYAAQLRDEPGRMGRRFVRADVSITAAEYTDAGEMIPYSGLSDVEDVLDQAAARTDGDAFPESSISREGLGRLVPRVDFDVGDLVPLLKWGKTLVAPVRSIEDVVEFGRVVDWNVFVGGELVADDDARERQIRELTRDIEAEKRETLAAVESVRETARSAKSRADAALAAVSDAEGVIAQALKEAEAASEAGRGHVESALAAAEQAAASVSSAQALADRAAQLVDEAEEVLGKNDELRQELDTLRAQLAQLNAQIDARLAALGAAVSDAEAHSAQALQHAENARVLVADAETVRAEVAGLLDGARAAVEDGRKSVQDAAAQYELAREAAGTASSKAAEAIKAAEDAGKALAAAREVEGEADQRLEDAAAALEAVQGEAVKLGEQLTKVDALQNEVLAKHEAVMKAHDEILGYHGAAIEHLRVGVKLSASAAASAGMTASLANETARHASDAAASALDASEKNTLAIDRLDEVAELHGQAIEEATAMGVELGKAQEELRKAQEIQAKISEDLAAADVKLAEADEKIQSQVSNLELALKILGQAVKVAAAASASAAMAAAHATQTAREAALAADRAFDAGEARQVVLDNVVAAQDAAAAADAARDEVVSKLSTEFTNARNLQAKINEALAYQIPKTFYWERTKQWENDSITFTNWVKLEFAKVPQSDPKFQSMSTSQQAALRQRYGSTADVYFLTVTRVGSWRGAIDIDWQNYTDPNTMMFATGFDTAAATQATRPIGWMDRMAPLRFRVRVFPESDNISIVA